MRFLAVFRDTI